MIDIAVIRNNILKAIKDSGVTQHKLSSEIKVSLRTLNGFLTGNKENISFDTILKIANYLDIPVEVIINSNPYSIDIYHISKILDDFPEDKRQIVIDTIKNTVDCLHSFYKKL